MIVLCLKVLSLAVAMWVLVGGVNVMAGGERDASLYSGTKV